MTLVRGDVTAINEADRTELLREFGVSLEHRLAIGTEAEVYALGTDRVLKLYTSSPAAILRLGVLREFYDCLDGARRESLVPRILELREKPGVLAVVETRIFGVSLEALLPTLSAAELLRAQDLYLEGLSLVSELRLSRPPSRYLLYDTSGRSSVSGMTWGQWYSDLLQHKLSLVESALNNCVANFDKRAEILFQFLAKRTTPDLYVVHGDYFPGNLLVTPDLSSVRGIVDFGSFSMYGDRLLDFGCAAGFYRMYESDRAVTRHAILDKIADRYSRAEAIGAGLYLACHAILTCDMYVTESDPTTNGHFQWAAEVLNDERLWG